VASKIHFADNACQMSHFNRSNLPTHAFGVSFLLFIGVSGSTEYFTRLLIPTNSIQAYISSAQNNADGWILLVKQQN